MFTSAANIFILVKQENRLKSIDMHVNISITSVLLSLLHLGDKIYSSMVQLLLNRGSITINESVYVEKKYYFWSILNFDINFID